MDHTSTDTKSARQSPSLLQHKLTRPSPGPVLISRKRLEDFFEVAEWAKLILVRAPVGFGKTTAMLQWYERLQNKGVKTAWLSVDEGDNDGGTFLAYLVAAFNKIDRSLELGEGLTGTLGERVSLAMLLNLLDSIGASQLPFCLFLDDFEKIQNPEVGDILRTIVANLPANGRLVIGSRDTPVFDLGRMRVKGQLAEIGAEELCFSLDETERFMRQGRGLDLDEEDLSRLQSRTEGWVAGLQLASLALQRPEDRKEFIRSFSGSFADIADYLAEDVLSHQSEEVQEFLLKTSILDRLTGPLCEAVTGREDGYEFLSQLEKANLFLKPLDKERRWYRYHNVFSQFLRSRLERSHRSQVAALHQAAARWYADQGDLAEAVHHAIAAGDTGLGVGLMARCALELVNLGQGSTVIDWVRRISPRALDLHPRLRFALALALILQHSYEEAEIHLDRLVKGGDEKPLDSVSPDHVNLIRSMLLLYADRFDECQRVTGESLAKATRSGAMGVMANNLAFCLVSEGKFDEAESLLHRARSWHSQTRNLLGGVYAECMEAGVQMGQGQLQTALSLCRSALAHAQEKGSAYSIPGALAATFLAAVLYELDELSEAERLLSGNIKLISHAGLVDVFVLGYVTLAKIHFAEGRHGEALQVLNEAEEVGRHRGVAPRLVASIRMTRARFALFRGDREAAKQMYEKYGAPKFWKAFGSRCMYANDPDTLEVQRLRLMIHCGEAREAIPALKAELSKVENSKWGRQIIKLKILQAIALDTCGKRADARRVLGEALRLASPNGHIRTFTDEGPAVIGLLQDLKQVAAADTGAGSGLPYKYLNRILRTNGAQGPTPVVPATGVDTGPRAELTQREIQVLELLAAGFSNKDLGNQLFISQPTVRFHLRNINEKLDAKNRIHAVSKARLFGLIA